MLLGRGELANQGVAVVVAAFADRKLKILAFAFVFLGRQTTKNRARVHVEGSFIDRKCNDDRHQKMILLLIEKLNLSSQERKQPYSRLHVIISCDATKMMQYFPIAFKGMRCVFPLAPEVLMCRSTSYIITL